MGNLTYRESYGLLQIFLLLAFVIPAVLFLLTQQNTLRRVKPENRRLLPGLVWLQLIPFFGQIWQFFVIVKIARSIKNELVYRHDDELFGSDAAKVELGNRHPTLVIGLVYSILMCVSYLLARYEATMRVSNSYSARGTLDMTRTAADIDTGSITLGFLGMATMVCWIVYWVSLAVWKRRLKERSRPI